jgi:hypothetical protein
MGNLKISVYIYGCTDNRPYCYTATCCRPSDSVWNHNCIDCTLCNFSRQRLGQQHRLGRTCPTSLYWCHLLSLLRTEWYSEIYTHGKWVLNKIENSEGRYSWISVEGVYNLYVTKTQSFSAILENRRQWFQAHLNLKLMLKLNDTCCWPTFLNTVPNRAEGKGASLHTEIYWGFRNNCT